MFMPDLLTDAILGIPGKKTTKDICTGCSLCKCAQLRGQMGAGIQPEL